MVLSRARVTVRRPPQMGTISTTSKDPSNGVAAAAAMTAKTTRRQGHPAPPSLTDSMRKRVQKSHPERAVSSKEEHELQRLPSPRQTPSEPAWNATTVFLV
jgi:hypothetical protein